MRRNRPEREHDYYLRSELEKQTTFREWDDRLNKHNGLEKKNTSSGGRGYRDYMGFLEYKNSNKDTIQPLSREEIEDMHRCFSMADVDGAGYLDCEGLKTFMEYRKTPITHLEAKNLIRKSDPQSNYYITLEQILTLAFKCGVATERERKISSASFTDVIKGLSTSSHRFEKQSVNSKIEDNRYQRQSSETTQFRNNVIEENLELHGAVSYFEDMATTVQTKSTEENLYLQYRKDIRKRQNEAKNPKNAQSSVLPPPPGWSTMILHSRDPSCQEPQRSVFSLKKEWEQKWPKPDQIEEEVEVRHKCSLDTIRFNQPVPFHTCKELTQERKAQLPQWKQKPIVLPSIPKPANSRVPSLEKWALVPYVNSKESTNIIFPPSAAPFDNNVSRQEI